MKPSPRMRRAPKQDHFFLRDKRIAALEKELAWCKHLVQQLALRLRPTSAGRAPAKLRKLRHAAVHLVELAMVREHVGVDLGVWNQAVRDLLRALGRVPRCRRCGCTDKRACAGGCYWVEAALCSKCDGKPDLLRRTS